MFIFAIVFMLNRNMKEIFHSAAASNLIWSSPKRSEQDEEPWNRDANILWGIWYRSTT